MTEYFTEIDSPVGKIALTSNGRELTGVYPETNTGYAKAKKAVHDPKPFTQAIKQFGEYFAGQRKEFDLPLAANGTEFQQKVWQQLSKISYGKTQSYGDIAKSLKSPTASRAVGAANGKNPLCIVVPCHRVIGTSGKLTGYNGGVKVKQWLLQHEAANNL